VSLASTELREEGICTERGREKGSGGKELVKPYTDIQGYEESHPPDIRFIHNDEKDQFDRIKRTRRGRWWYSKNIPQCGTTTSPGKSRSRWAKYLFHRISW